MRRILPASCLVVLIAASSFALAAGHEPPAPPETPAPPAPLRAAAAKIIGAARSGDHAWRTLARLCDEVGPRLSGTPAYPKAAEWAAARMRELGLADVRLEPVTATQWVRGTETLSIVAPGPERRLAVVGLGRSVGTPAAGITAPALVVRDFEEFERRKDEARGKIVVFNFAMKEQPEMFRSYGEAVSYRWTGSSRAAKVGAAAMIVRSVTTLRARAPHTGVMGYEDGVPKIPGAAASVEDVEGLQRLQDAGTPATLRLVLDDREGGTVAEANVVGEIKGTERPNEIVVIGAHLDSWDLACGAHDDGAGVAMALETVRVLKETGLAPKRTVRVVLFDGEEWGIVGGKAYFEAHRGELKAHHAALEADAGGFRPVGFSCAGAQDRVERIESWLPLFQPLGSLWLRKGGGGPDIGPLAKEGVTSLGLTTDSRHYFDYHHSALDTADKVDPSELDDAAAAYALMTYLLANE